MKPPSRPLAPSTLFPADEPPTPHVQGWFTPRVDAQTTNITMSSRRYMYVYVYACVRIRLYVPGRILFVRVCMRLYLFVPVCGCVRARMF